MHIWGKILGFLFGFMLSKNLMGALLGAWLGHLFDNGRRLNFEGFSPNKSDDVTRQAVFFYTSFSVMGHMAKANGQVSKHEIAFASAYMDKMALTGGMRQQAQDAFREGKTSGFPFDERLRKFKRSCGHRHDLLLMFLEIQIQVAFSDGSLDAAERSVLHHIAQQLGFSAPELDKLLAMIIAGAAFNQGSAYKSGRQPAGSQQLTNAYKVLGINKDTERKDLKKAYKKLMSQHHPDKLIAKGLPPEMMAVAKQKTQDIQAAYDLISKNS
jgi:DnaJ like chaperone protein